MEDQTNNPYSTPESDVASPLGDDENVQRVISGQKLILYAILVNLLANFTANAVPAFGIIAFIVAIGMSITGLARLGKGLGYHTVVVVLLCISMILPLINLIVLLVVNSRATKRIREAGYKVGLMGAKL